MSVLPDVKADSMADAVEHADDVAPPGIDDADNTLTSKIIKIYHLMLMIIIARSTSCIDTCGAHLVFIINDAAS